MPYDIICDLPLCSIIQGPIPLKGAQHPLTMLSLLVIVSLTILLLTIFSFLLYYLINSIVPIMTILSTIVNMLIN